MNSQAKRLWRAASLPAASFMLGVMLGAPAQAQPSTVLHYTSNGNFDQSGNYLPGAVGFNVADINSPRELNYLPAGVKGLVWVGQCNGVDSTFLSTVQPYIGNAHVLGFYLMDLPDPTGRWNPLCPAANLMAESDWIHANMPGAKTFIILMNMSSSQTPSYTDSYNPSNSHIDLFGLDPYPCRTELNGCNYNIIDAYVTAAESSGISRRSVVPVYQAFGGGKWLDEGGGQYALPTASQERQILARWGTLVPAPVFDYAYSWGSQKADEALESAPDLQAVFSLNNRATRP